MKPIISRLLGGLDLLGLWLGLLSLRLLLGWDFFESGLEKLHGENWFADIQDRFPFPFNLVPVELSWQMATWFELIGSVALVIGLGAAVYGGLIWGFRIGGRDELAVVLGKARAKLGLGA